jgi:hypothetical protein
MSSVLYTALAAGVLGLMAGLKSANDDMRRKILADATPKEQEMAEECLACAEFMQQNDNAIPRELQSHPSIAACKKIKLLPPKKLEQLLRKFLKSDRINREKLAQLTKMCNGKNESSCLASQIHGTTAQTNSELSSKSSHRSSRSEPTSTGATSSREEWISVDFNWDSDDDVASSMTGYSM